MLPKHEHKSEASDKLAHRKLAKEKLAFLPAALEIQAAPPAKWSRSLLWSIISLLLMLNLLAALAEI